MGGGTLDLIWKGDKQSIEGGDTEIDFYRHEMTWCGFDYS